LGFVGTCQTNGKLVLDIVTNQICNEKSHEGKSLNFQNGVFLG